MGHPDLYGFEGEMDGIGWFLDIKAFRGAYLGYSWGDNGIRPS